MSSLLIVLLGIPLFFTPKINLIDVSGETAGVRIDDLVMVVIALCVLHKKFKERIGSINFFESRMFLLFFLMSVSNVINTVFFDNSSYFYSIRIVEYFLFFYVGSESSSKLKISSVCWLILLANAPVMIGQYLGRIGGYASAGYAESVDRAFGLTGGPWEIGTVLNFVFCVFAFDDRHGRSKVLLIFLFSLGLILLTRARQPLAVHLLLCLIYLSKGVQSPYTRIVAAAIFIFVAIGLIIAFPGNPIVERSTGLISFENAREIAYQFSHADINISGFSGFDEIDTSNNDIDLSWTYRLYKWAIALVSWMGHPSSWLIGFGPGMWGTALDGGWIRLITESGLIGFAIFVSLLRKMSSLGASMKYIIIALSLNMIMIDVEIAYKVQQFLFFSAGYYWSNKVRATDVSKSSLPQGPQKSTLTL